MDRYFVASKTIDLPFKVPNEEFSLKTRKQVQNFIMNYKIGKREPAFFFLIAGRLGLGRKVCLELPGGKIARGTSNSP